MDLLLEYGVVQPDKESETERMSETEGTSEMEGDSEGGKHVRLEGSGGGE